MTPAGGDDAIDPDGVRPGTTAAVGPDHHARGGEGLRPSDPLARVMLVLAVVRYVIPLAAIPAIPFLLREHFTLLVLLRPTKEFLLLGGGLARVQGDPTLSLLFAAYVPLMLLAVWPFFVVGRAYRSALRTGDGPAWLHRAIPPEQFEVAQRVLARRGPTIAVLGRIAALPPTLLAAAAGASEVPARRYLLADAAGGLAAFAVTAGAGYALGQAYEDGGAWVTAIGVVLFVSLVLLLTRWIRREAAAPPPGVATDPSGAPGPTDTTGR